MKNPAVSLWARTERTWFRSVSATGYGLMRIGFGVTTLALYLMQWSNVWRWYSTNGVLPQEMVSQVLRHEYRYSLLDVLPADWVFPVYIVFIVSLVLTTLGLWTRASLIITTFLLFSFNEYAIITLDGGDTLLRILCFFLLLAPSGNAMSLDNLWLRIRSTKATGQDQPDSARTMPIWPYRLLMWQMTVLYISASWHKFLGTMWPGGTAVSIALHHSHFSRLPLWVADLTTPLSPILGWFVLIAQASWALLVIVPVLAWVRVPGMQWVKALPIKRALLIAGAMIHIGIGVFMEVGTFSLAVLASYLGLLIDEDFLAMRNALNFFFGKKKITVLFDGRCGFCKKTILLLKVCDWLQRLNFVNFYDTAAREEVAPKVSLAALQQAMHVSMPSKRIYKGFDGFRELCWHLPPLWILAPFLYVPGAKLLGDPAYEWVAAHRK